MQTLQVKLFATDQRIDSHRESANEHDRDLKVHVANWKTQSLIDQLETACDL